MLKAKLDSIRKNKKGFSLVELIIVIAIMVALIAVLAPSYVKYVQKSRDSAVSTAAEDFVTAFKTLLADPDTVLTNYMQDADKTADDTKPVVKPAATSDNGTYGTATTYCLKQDDNDYLRVFKGSKDVSTSDALIKDVIKVAGLDINKKMGSSELVYYIKVAVKLEKSQAGTTYIIDIKGPAQGSSTNLSF